MQVRLILGGIDLGTRQHAIGKLNNGRYAVGHLWPGKPVPPQHQFASLDAAFEYWYANLPCQPRAQPTVA